MQINSFYIINLIFFLQVYFAIKFLCNWTPSISYSLSLSSELVNSLWLLTMHFLHKGDVECIVFSVLCYLAL